jgi:hypothetical protein
MRIAAYVHPIVHSLGPEFNHSWLEILAQILQVLRHEAGNECMLITGAWHYRWARENGRTDILEGLRVAALDEVSLYRKLSAAGPLPTCLDRLAYARQKDHPALQILSDEVAGNTNGFRPDIVISFAIQIDFLKMLWPTAVMLHVETGPYTRNPYPFSLFFDHIGMYKRSAIAQHGMQLRSHPISKDGRLLISKFRSHYASALAAIDPFRSHNFRERFSRLCLLPLQVCNYYSFDEQSSYRTQFEYLVDVLSAAPADVGVIVTEYVEFGPIIKKWGPDDNWNYLHERFSNLIFMEELRSFKSPSQFLVPRVDGVWSVSSNVGYQALLFERLLGSPTTTHFANIAHTNSLNDFFEKIGECRYIDNDQILAWQLMHYLVPEFLLKNGKWLNKYLERRLCAISKIDDQVDAFVAIADIDELEEAWIGHAPAPEAFPYIQPAYPAVMKADPPSEDANALGELARDAVEEVNVMWDKARAAIDEAQTMKETAQFAIEQAYAALAAVHAQNMAILSSTSWRLTGPLRVIAIGLRLLFSLISKFAAKPTSFEAQASITANPRIQ